MKFEPLHTAALAAILLAGCNIEVDLTCDIEPAGGDCYLATCDDGTEVVICNGADGADGSDGVDGTDGVAGTDGVDGTNGTDGTNGVDGADGADGASWVPDYTAEICGWWLSQCGRYDGNDGRVFTSLSDCLVTVANDLTDVQRECLLAGIDAFTYSDAHNGDPYHYCLATDLGWGVCI